MSTKTEAVEPIYDLGTKIWTSILGVVVAGLVDWVSVFDPARRVPPEDPKMSGWTVALILAVAFPSAWLVGHGLRRQKRATFAWLCVVLALAALQVVVIRVGG